MEHRHDSKPSSSPRQPWITQYPYATSSDCENSSSLSNSIGFSDHSEDAMSVDTPIQATPGLGPPPQASMHTSSRTESPVDSQQGARMLRVHEGFRHDPNHIESIMTKSSTSAGYDAQSSSISKWTSLTASYSLQQGHQQTRASDPFAAKQPLSCVVCDKKPRHTYHLTCGLTCANKYKALQSECKGFGSTTKTKARASICPVCQKKPCAISRTGKQYPTCGFSCSSNLPVPKAAAEMCEFCGTKAKRLNTATNQYYSHCGRTCRDNAEAKAQAASVRGKCSTCVVCWRKNSTHSELPYCEERCREAVMERVPTLIEIPNGHTHFYTVSDQFKSQWDTTRHHFPTIRHIYRLVPRNAVLERHEAFKTHLNETLHRRPKETKRWISIPRWCSTGASGIISHCSDPSCNLCNIIENGILIHPDGGSILTFSTAEAAAAAGLCAFENDKRKGKRPEKEVEVENWTKTMILADVVSAKEVTMTRDELYANPTGHGHNFVRIAGNTRELHVYAHEAVLAEYLIVYS